ncbi:MAG: HEAT repeat domain-containing protein [Chloroflexi bacterium]|nr:HEAT repeat domain-containing protein [Chloroflexota bacterium]
MDSKNESLPFTQVLDALFEGETLPIHLLFRLSDMTASERDEFGMRWTAVSAERRRVMMRHMADLSEENYVVDFAPILITCLTDSEAAVRAAALDGLWDVTDGRMAQPIIRLLQTDESEVVRVAAAKALAHFVLMAEWDQLSPRITKPIVEALLAEYEKPDAAISIKRAALEALGAANHPRIAELIVTAYDDIDETLQTSAVYAMGQSADKRWLPTVLAEMENPDPAMRVVAARASGIFGSSDAISPLEELLFDEDLEVRLSAVLAIGQIGGDSATRILLELGEDDEYADLHEAIEEALGEIAMIAGELDFLGMQEYEDEDDNLLLN